MGKKKKSSETRSKTGLPRNDPNYLKTYKALHWDIDDDEENKSKRLWKEASRLGKAVRRNFGQDYFITEYKKTIMSPLQLQLWLLVSANDPLCENCSEGCSGCWYSSVTRKAFTKDGTTLGAMSNSGGHGSPRILAPSIRHLRCLMIRGCPTKSLNVLGGRAITSSCR